ncbi:MAG TPA: NAD(P)-dependent oxidoreductase [Acidimicrobiia bacterium]|nr:NAD(P)-dependent oxidoreductase [Acidimicrobiia bacterium]
MKALVTGSAGFIGRHVVARLRSGGHDVVGLDRRPSASTDRTLDLADRRSLTGLASLLSDVDVVFHLAARPGVRDSHPHIEQIRFRDNVVATHNLFEAAPAHVAIVVTSSSSVYGGAGRMGGFVRPCRESDPLAPRGGYATSKVEVERLSQERRRGGGRVSVIRPFTVVGEGQRSDMALAIWSDAIRHRRPIRLLGSPDRVRDVTDVHAVVRGLIQAASVGHDGVLNLGTGVGQRLSDLAAALLRASGGATEVVVADAPEEEAEITLADTTLCGQVLGFVPVTDVNAVARRVWESSVTMRRVGASAR